MVTLLGFVLAGVILLYWLRGTVFGALLATPAFLYAAILIHGLGVDPQHPPTLFGEVGSMFAGAAFAWVAVFVRQQSSRPRVVVMAPARRVKAVVEREPPMPPFSRPFPIEKRIEPRLFTSASGR